MKIMLVIQNWEKGSAIRGTMILQDFPPEIAKSPCPQGSREVNLKHGMGDEVPRGTRKWNLASIMRMEHFKLSIIVDYILFNEQGTF